MPLIQLTQGKEALVSRADFAFLNQWKWYASAGCKCFYAHRHQCVEDGYECVSMHRLIAARRGLDLTHLIDHIDGDGLNNCRSNLRAATAAQNQQNRGKPKSNSSGFKGVSWHKKTSKWRAYIRVQRVQRHLGNFDTKEEAAEAYRKAAKKVHKEFASV